MLKPHKFNARKVALDGYTFDSKAEAAHYERLKRNEDVCTLEIHPKFVLLHTFEADGMKYPAVTYTADFMYTSAQTGQIVVIDVKGMILPEFKIKWKLFRSFYPEFKAILVDAKGREMTLYKPRKKRAA